MSTKQDPIMSEVLREDLRQSLKQLVSSKNEVQIDFKGDLKLDTADYYDRLRSEVEFEFESALEHLNKMRETLIKDINKHEKRSIDRIELDAVKINRLQARWSHVSARVDLAERKVLASLENQDTAGDFLDHKREISVLQAEVVKANIERKNILFSTGKFLTLEPFNPQYDYFYKHVDLLGNLKEKKADVLYKNGKIFRVEVVFESKLKNELNFLEYKKIENLSRYFETSQLYDMERIQG